MGDFGYSLAGLIVGFVVGVTGVGGGALMTPILILVFGLQASVAVGTDLLYAAITKGFGTWFHNTKGTVEWPVVGLLAMGSIPATLVTIATMHHLGIDEGMEKLIAITLCIAISLTATFTLFRSQIAAASRHESLRFLKVVHRRYRKRLTVLGGVVLGVLVSLSSVGAGVIGAVLLLLLYPRLPAISVVGTDLAHAVPLTLIAGLGHWALLGTVNLPILGFLLIGSIPGIYLGSRVGFRIPDQYLRPVIAAILLLIAGGLLVESAAAQFSY